MSAPRGGVLRKIWCRAQDEESGMALVLVVGSMLVLAMLALTALAFTMSSQRFARYTQDYTAAMAAAQSGVDDYISRLNRDDQYGYTVDCANGALKGPMSPASNSCGYTTTTAAGWLPVAPGETDAEAAHFHYSADTSRSRIEGTILLTVTGRVNGEYRTIEAAVGKGGSTDFVYYTDFESADPANVQAYAPAGATDTRCGAGGYENALYWYEGRRYASCTEITFVSGDRLDGAVFTNDAALSDGAHFLQGFQSANPGCNSVTASSTTWRNCLRQDGKNSTADFNGLRPAYAEPLYLDDTSAAFASYPGCHYYGSTRIVFNAGGTMTVWNKKANNGNTAPLVISAAGLPTPSCGTLDGLDSTSGATVPVPDQMVIYVDDAPASVPARRCDSGEIGGPSSGNSLPLGTYNRVTHPDTSGGSHPQYVYDTNMTEATKTCNRGNVYIEGAVKGRVTVASAQSIVAVGDVVLAGGHNGGDMLGLVATNTVEVFHPRTTTFVWDRFNSTCGTSGATSYRYCPSGSVAPSDVSGWPRRYVDPTTGGYNPSSGIQIAGSIQTLQHSFLVQKYGEGPNQGTLNVFGSIAQRWRGIVGRGTSGYTKLYEYDRRLITAAPPYFPRWVNAQWTLRYSGEIPTPGSVQ